MSYAAWSVIAGEQPTTSKWNILGANDSSFNDGTGIGNAVITANKLATGAAAATVATSQTTASTSYVDLGTVGPAVTVTIGANGLALATVYALTSNDTINSANIMSFAVSGATTVAAADNFAFIMRAHTAAQSSAASATFLVTGLTAGSNTFTAKYDVNAGTGTWLNRRISVIPL